MQPTTKGCDNLDERYFRVVFGESTVIIKLRQRVPEVRAVGLPSCVDSEKERPAKRYKSLLELSDGPEIRAGVMPSGQADQEKPISDNHGATRSLRAL